MYYNPLTFDFTQTFKLLASNQNIVFNTLIQVNYEGIYIFVKVVRIWKAIVNYKFRKDEKSIPLYLHIFFH